MHTHSRNNSDKSSSSATRLFFNKADTNESSSEAFFNPVTLPSTPFLQAKCQHCQHEERINRRVANEVSPERDSQEEDSIQAKSENQVVSDLPMNTADNSTGVGVSNKINAKPALKHDSHVTADSRTVTHAGKAESVKTTVSASNFTVQHLPVSEKDEVLSEEKEEPNLVQTKLSISSPNDPFEVEADSMAERILRMPQPPSQGSDARFLGAGNSSDSGSPDVIWRQSLNGEPPLLDLPDESSVSGLTVQCLEHKQNRDNISAEKCDACGGSTRVQEKSEVGGSVSGESANRLQSRLDAKKGQGAPLSSADRTFFESRFARDFKDIRVHTDSDAQNLAHGLSAQAFTYGSDIFFSSGRFKPHTNEGRVLLAHELTHTIQQGKSSRLSPLIQRNGQRDNIQNPPDTTMNVALSGLTLRPVNGTWTNSPRQNQAIAIVLKRFAGPTYRSDLVNEFLQWSQTQASGPITISGSLNELGEAPMDVFHISGDLPFELMTFIQSHAGTQTTLHLDENQIRLITLGRGAESGWSDIQELQRRGVVSLPNWFTRNLFFEQIGSRVELLTNYMTALAALRQHSTPANTQAVIEAVREIVSSLNEQTAVVEAIRTDANLIHSVMYRLIWPPPARRRGESLDSRLRRDRTSIAPATADAANATFLDQFLTYLRTQPSLARRAVGNDAADAHNARRTLLDRFERYVQRIVPGGSGDQALSSQPGRLATDSAHPSRLDVYPVLEPPFFDAALNTEHHFTMNLEFPSVFDAFASYTYRFALFKVPDNQVIGAAQSSAGPTSSDIARAESPQAIAKDVASSRIDAPPQGGEEVHQGTGAVLGNSLTRDARYLRADVLTAIRSMRTNFGTPGVSVELVAINGLLRFAGTLIKSFLNTIFEPSYAKEFIFPDEGLYLVRAIAYPHLTDEAEVTRPPSVAYVPVFARDPTVMAEDRVRAQVTQAEHERDRQREIEQMLRNPQLTGQARTDLERELRDLRFSSGDVGTQIAAQYWQLDGMIHQLETEILRGYPRDSDTGQSLLRYDPKAAQYHALIRQRDALRDIYNTRSNRGNLTGAERITATFVSDQGQSINLVIEALDCTPKGQSTPQSWFISDSTTPNSGAQPGTGKNKVEAIQNAVRTLFQSGAGYGRGVVSLVINSQAYSMRIEANSDELLMEALENVATIASIAAIAAAPFTGGSSLYLLIPIGVIGAIPSAYRIAQRVDNDTFHWDLQTASDIVNIVSAVLSVSEVAVAARSASAAALATRSGARVFTLSGALMITNFGANGLGIVLLGAGLWRQLEATSELPPGLRQARIAEIVGQAMLQAGIMIGGTLASHRYQSRLQGGIESSETSQSRWFAGLSEETRTRLNSDPELMDLYSNMRPDIRALLTRCGSWCIPIDHPPDVNLQNRLQALVDRLNPTAEDRRFLQTYFHDNRAHLDTAIAALEGHQSMQSMRQFLHSTINAADVVLMAFKPETIPRGQEPSATVSRMLQDGHIDVSTLSSIMDQAYAKGMRGQAVVRLLNNLEMLTYTHRPGFEAVLADLARGYHFFTGAEFVLRYISDNSLWGVVTRFEIESAPGGRRWDAEINGTLIQFKRWSVFWSSSFLRQFANDFQLTGGFQQRALRWIFDSRLGSRVDIENMAILAIQDAASRTTPLQGYTNPQTVQAMIQAIRSGNIIMVH